MHKDERETHINHEVGAGKLHVYSTEPRIWRRCDSIGMTLVDSTRTASGREIARQYSGDFGPFNFQVRRKSQKQVEAAKRRANSAKVSGTSILDRLRRNGVVDPQ